MSCDLIDIDKYVCTKAGFVALPQTVKQIQEEAKTLDEQTVGYLIAAANEAVHYGVERNHALCMSYMVGLCRNEKAY